VFLGFEDVTTYVLKGIRDKMDPVKRTKRIQKNILSLSQKTEGKNGVDRVSIVGMFSGKFYQMYKYKEIKDIRIVYAPPMTIGKYGGDIDNWMWPRHTGDFTFLRAYVSKDGKGAEYSRDNVPFKPKKYLPFSTRTVKKDDLTFIMGHPGRTQRYRSSNAAEYSQKYSYPDMVAAFADLIAIIEECGKNNKDIQIKYAGLHSGLNNGLKNRQGMLDGFTKLKFLDNKLKLEKQMMDFVAKHPKLKKEYGSVIDDIGKLYAKLVKNSKRDTYFNYLRISNVISNAIMSYRWSLEKVKPELEREPGFDNKTIKRVKRALPIRYRNLVPGVDSRFLEYFLLKLVDLPEDVQYDAFKEIYAGKKDKTKAVKQFVKDIYSTTRLTKLSEYQKMLNMSNKELLALKDPAVIFAKKLYPFIKKANLENKKFAGLISKLRPRYAELVGIYKAYKDKKKLPSLKIMKNAIMKLYPDATFTQRFTYGVIRGYSPADAVNYDWKTTLKGVLQKDTGKDPFNAPHKLYELYKKKDYGIYSDPGTGELIVNYLHTTDITGGNSGSPVINAYGEYMGIAFDGNYEAMTSDWQFSNKLTRTISVDSRYILFIVDKFSNAQNLIKELEIHK
jgi:hypothetical protein